MLEVQIVSVINRYEDLDHANLGDLCGFLGLIPDPRDYYAAQFN
jgi:hypothetical protein